MEFDLYLKIIMRRRYVFLSLFLCILLTPFIFSIGKGPIYKKSSVIMFQQVDIQTTFLSVLPKAFGEISFFDSKDSEDNFQAILEDETNIQQVISDLHYDLSVDELYSSLPFLKFLFSPQQQALSIKSTAGSELFEISGYAPSSAEAASISIKMVEAVDASWSAMMKKACLRIQKTLEIYNEKINDDLAVLLDQKNNFVEQHTYIDFGIQLANLYDEISQNKKESQTIRRFLEKVEKEQEELAIKLKEISEFQDVSQEIIRNPLILNAESKLDELMWSLAEKKVQLTEKHKDIVSLNKVIAEVKETMKQESLKIFAKEVKERNSYHTKLINEYNDNLIKAVTSKLDLQILDRFIKKSTEDAVRLAQLNAKYQLILDDITFQKDNILKVETALASLSYVEKMDLSSFTILHRADMTSDDSSEYFPDYKPILFSAAFVAFWVAFVVTLFMDYIDPSLKSTERLEALLGVSVLAEIPHVSSRGKISSTLVVSKGKRPIRQIVSWLKKEDQGGLSRVVGLTSSQLTEGVTTLACLLAERLAALGDTVLLVEANAINPGFQQLYNLEANKRQDGEPEAWRVAQVATNLGVLFLRDKEIQSFYLDQNFLRNVQSSFATKNTYQWVIVDLPPLEEDQGAIEIIDQCDAVLYTIAPWKVTLRNVEKGHNQLKRRETLLARTSFIVNQHRPLWLVQQLKRHHIPVPRWFS